MRITAQYLAKAKLTYMTQSDDWTPGMDPRKQYVHVPGYRCNCGKIYTEGDTVGSVSGKMERSSAVWMSCTNCGSSFGGLKLDSDNYAILKKMED